MTPSDYPLAVRLYYRSSHILQTLFVCCEAALVGFWLGIFKRETLHLIDEIYYDSQKKYCDDDYNRSGLREWEQRAIGQYFQPRQRLLLVGAGGGREVLALHQLGYDVDSFECNSKLAEYANQLLRKEGFTKSIEVSPRDECPLTNQLYDGAIIGWGAYMLIEGSTRRIAFLQQLRSQVREESPLLVSFYGRSIGNKRRLKIIAATGNIIRCLLRRELLKVGDDMVPNYVHYFSQEDIATELHEGGFKLAFYWPGSLKSNDYGYAIGLACKREGVT